MMNIDKQKRISFKKLQEILPKNILYDLLWEKNLTYKGVSKIYNIDVHQISKLAKYYEIKKNDCVINQARTKERTKIFDEEELIELYCNKKLSIREIAKLKNVQHNTISKRLKRLGLLIRSAHDELYYINRTYRSRSSDYYISDNGYLKTIDDQYVHRLVMQEYLRRELNSDEYVHHIDFDKLNNDIKNLFIFSSNNIHLLYHGYIENNDYISPEEYLIYYEQNLKNTFENYNWLYNEYIKKKLSCNEISKELKISRLAVTNKLKNLGIYDLRNPTINQYI